MLDNCEHVLDGVAPLVERLLGDCPKLTVLATSRARLMVPFERVFPVPPLSLPADDGGRTRSRLFIERAAAAGWPVAAADRDRVADDLPCARRHGAGDRTGGGTAAGARARRPARGAVRSAAAARRRPPRR